MIYLRSRDREVYMREASRKDGFVYMNRIYCVHSGKGPSYGCYTAVYREGTVPVAYESISEKEYTDGVENILKEIRTLMCRGVKYV